MPATRLDLGGVPVQVLLTLVDESVEALFRLDFAKLGTRYRIGLLKVDAPAGRFTVARTSIVPDIDGSGRRRLWALCMSIVKMEGHHPDHPPGENCVIGPRAHVPDRVQVLLLARYLRGVPPRELQGSHYKSRQALMQAMRQPLRDRMRFTYRKYASKPYGGIALEDAPFFGEIPVDDGTARAAWWSRLAHPYGPA